MRDGQTSTVSREGDTVVKTIVNWMDYNVFEREVIALEMLKDFDWAPKLLKVDEELKEIHMSYIGEPVSRDNVPQDAMSQCLKILDDMKSLKMKHNDIKQNEVLVNDGKIHLCDFGWCSVSGDFSLNREDICGDEKPYGIIDDSVILRICKKALSSTE